MIAQVFDMNTWLYPDDAVRADGQQSACVACARGSYACFQVLLLDVPEGEIACRMTGDVQKASIRRLVPVCVDKNTGVIGMVVENGTPAEYTTRQAPFEVYDALADMRGEYGQVKAGDRNAALYVSVPIAADSPAGMMQGALDVTVGGRNVRIDVEIQVSRAMVPQKGTLKIINWCNYGCMADGHGVERWSEAHWELIRRYGEMMRHGRQTHFLLTMELVQWTEQADGSYVFDFSRAEKLIDLYGGMGFGYLESGLILARERYEDEHFIIRAGDKVLPALSLAGYRFMYAYFTQLRQMLERKGWLGRTVQHVADEPFAACLADYRALASIVRKLMPGIKLIDAIEDPDVFGAVDEIVSKNFYYENNRAVFDAYRNMGCELWFYTCCHPGGNYMNRTLDFSLLRTRYLHWGNYIYDLKGYLHWGLNIYSAIGHPFRGRLDGGRWDLPCGDTHILYPDGDRVMSSARFEAMRAGIEDYELLMQLAQKDKQRADELSAMCVRSFSDFTDDAKFFDHVHRLLLDAAGKTA